jgi:hypothetical protein
VALAPAGEALHLPVIPNGRLSVRAATTAYSSNAGARDMKPVEVKNQSEVLRSDPVCGSDFSRDLDQAPFRFAQSWPKATPTAQAAPFLLALLSVLMILLAFPLPLHAQIEWTPEAQVNWDDLYDDWMPMVAAGPDGRIWVVWQQSGPRGWEVFASVWEGNGWSYPQSVCGDDGVEDALCDIAVGPDGVPCVVVVEYLWPLGTPPHLHYTRWNGAGWVPPEPMFPDMPEEPEPSPWFRCSASKPARHRSAVPASLDLVQPPWERAMDRCLCPTWRRRSEYAGPSASREPGESVLRATLRAPGFAPGSRR